MKMTEFKVQNFRSIGDSGWIKVEDIAVIVGKNEAGKTSLLKALWKFNPFKDEPYNLDREWPRGRRKDRSPDRPVCSVRFEFTDEERKKIHAIDETCAHVTGAEVTRYYKGNFTYSFLPSQVSTEEWIGRVEDEVAGASPQGTSAHFLTELKNAMKRSKGTGQSTKDSSEKLKQIKTAIGSFVSSQEEEKSRDLEAVKVVGQALDTAISKLEGPKPIKTAIDLAHDWLPKFIYMDDHKIFAGSAFLGQVKERKDQGRLTEEDKTIILIMEMSGLNLDQEVEKSRQNDKEQRMLDMNDASQTLTNDISTRWRQKKYEVMFQVDGNHFMTFVKDDGGKALVPLDERSKGFQWFFSFDMTFMYETNGRFENAVILLDEPGLHLHAEAQRDLLERFQAYSKNNQLIYTTHLPFMIDCRRLDNIWVCEDRGAEGAVVHQNWQSADKDARFTLQAALGISWSQSLFVGQFNLIVEGVTDFWFLTTMSSMLKDGGKVGIDDGLIITPAGGATKVAYVGTLLNGQQLNVAVLLDSDTEGQAAHQQLVRQWIMSEKHVLMLGSILKRSGSCVLEDLFSEAYYISQVTDAYKTELAGRTLNLGQEKLPIVERVEIALSKLGIEPFNKGRVAKRIMTDLAKKKLSDIPEDMVTNFEKVFGALNQTLSQWRSKTSIPIPAKSASENEIREASP